MQTATMNPTEVNKAVFFNSMSHEFRTSLTTILMSVELLEVENQNCECQEHSNQYTNLIREAAENMRHLLNEAMFYLPSE